jgi:hypothetical protein
LLGVQTPLVRDLGNNNVFVLVFRVQLLSELNPNKSFWSLEVVGKTTKNFKKTQEEGP